MKKLYQVNDFITLKLENGETNIYVDGERFIQCKILLIETPVKYELDNDGRDSIDEFTYNHKNGNNSFPTDNLYYNFDKENIYNEYKFRIEPEIEVHYLYMYPTVK